MRSLIITLCLVVTAFALQAQSNPQEQELEEVYSYIKKDKIDEADSMLNLLLQRHPDYGQAWDLMARIRYAQYQQAKETGNIFENMKFTVQDENGVEQNPDDDTSLVALRKMLAKIDPAKMAFSKFEYTLRKATALSREAYMSSVQLRAYNIDVNVDSNVNRKALKHFEEAEKEFEERNYNKAALLYKRAIEAQPGFYKASMYLGDCYYMTENYLEAINAFKAAATEYPNLLEPHKYLADAYSKLSIYDKAADEALLSLTVYPDYSMMGKLEDALYLNHKRLEIGWTPRAVLPNRKVNVAEENDLNTYNGDTTMVATGPWVYYQKAAEKADAYYNKDGILKANPLTKSRYLEVYSWEEMLKNSKDPALDEARRMQQLGYLDCYVLVSCFHYDFYPQYRDFVARNKDRVLQYYKTFTKLQ